MAAPAPSGPIGEDDVELLRRIRKGEEEALQQLHRRYAPLVFHLACRSLDRAAAEEIVQDTFLAVWRRAADFDPARGSFRTWLLSIGRHRMLDELRSRSRRPQASGEQLLDPATLSAEEPHPDETLWLEYQRDAVSGALAALPEPQRAALRLAFFADLTHEEVAKALKVPLGTAKTRIRSRPEAPGAAPGWAGGRSDPRPRRLWLLALPPTCHRGSPGRTGSAPPVGQPDEGPAPGSRWRRFPSGDRHACHLPECPRLGPRGADLDALPGPTPRSPLRALAPERPGMAASGPEWARPGRQGPPDSRKSWARRGLAPGAPHHL